MAKTIAITPSWYWPSGTPRVMGVPPLRVDELSVARWARLTPGSLALVCEHSRWTWRDLAEEVASRIGAVREQEAVDLQAAAPDERVVALLVGLAAGVPVRVGGAGSQAAPRAETGGAKLPTGTDPLTLAAVAVPGVLGTVWLSQRSLVAGGLSLGAFLGMRATGTAVLVTALQLSTWQGLYGVLVPLLAGLTVVVAQPGAGALEAAARESATWLYTDLGDAYRWTHDAKRELKALRGTLGAAVVAVDGPFDSEQRRRLSRMLGCPALTLFGLPETGPIFASHASWYIDEAVGIPVTNAHVVPADPRTGRPLSTLWELVESAMVTVSGPSLCVRWDDRTRWLGDGRLATGVIASSDPNGMIYLVPE
ncbi:MAG: class I adenylate-forming enzyme family protein [Acidimicrobiales bacterium]